MVAFPQDIEKIQCEVGWEKMMKRKRRVLEWLCILWILSCLFVAHLDAASLFKGRRIYLSDDDKRVFKIGVTGTTAGYNYIALVEDAQQDQEQACKTHEPRLRHRLSALCYGTAQARCGGGWGSPAAALAGRLLRNRRLRAPPFRRQGLHESQVTHLHGLRQPLSPLLPDRENR